MSTIFRFLASFVQSDVCCDLLSVLLQLQPVPHRSKQSFLKTRLWNSDTWTDHETPVFVRKTANSFLFQFNLENDCIKSTESQPVTSNMVKTLSQISLWNFSESFYNVGFIYFLYLELEKFQI